MIRVSTTDLESFRRVIDTEWGNEEELVSKIMGKPFESSWQMQAGSAWDRIIGGMYGCDEGIVSEPFSVYSFRLGAVNLAHQKIGPGLWQVKQTIEVPSSRGPVTLVGVADHVNGLVIQENKACFSAPSHKNYEQGLQWRFYLWMFGANTFQYNLFDFKDPKDGYCELINIISFRLWPYPGLASDCQQWLEEFLDWADSRGLMKFLDRKGSTPAAA